MFSATLTLQAEDASAAPGRAPHFDHLTSTLNARSDDPLLVSSARRLLTHRYYTLFLCVLIDHALQ
jgi:hypothetical protein